MSAYTVSTTQVELYSQLSSLYRQVGLPKQAVHWQRKGVEAARKLGNTGADNLADLVHSDLLPRAGGGQGDRLALLAGTQTELAMLLCHVGDFEEAHGLCTEARRLVSKLPLNTNHAALGDLCFSVLVAQCEVSRGLGKEGKLGAASKKLQ